MHDYVTIVKICVMKSYVMKEYKKNKKNNEKNLSRPHTVPYYIHIDDHFVAECLAIKGFNLFDYEFDEKYF